MLRTCKMCGAEFSTSLQRIKYCSGKCFDKSVWIKDHPGRPEDGLFRSVCPWCGKLFTSERKRKFCSAQCTKAKALQDAKDIRAEVYKTHEHFCLRCGKPVSFSNRGKTSSFCSIECRNKFRNPGEPNYLTDDILRYKTSAKFENLEYVAKKSGSDKIVFRCKVCGGTFEHTSQVLRRDKFKGECPICKRQMIAEAAKQNAEQNARKVLNNKIIRALLMRKNHLEDEAIRVRECAICGKSFRSVWGKSCCSDECIEKRAKQANHAHSKRRRAIMKNRANAACNADNLTWQSIFDEERGVCYLCGEKCNPKDYRVVDGAFISGETYPSIDHVVALANGGLHTRENVKLAHFKCNWIKRDT